MSAIDLKNISFTYSHTGFTLRNINLSFFPREFTAIMGDNGSGKTTLGKLMGGLLKPDYGNILVFGKDSSKMTLGEIGGKVGYLFQNPDKQLFTPSVEEEIAFSLELKGYPKEDIKLAAEEMLEFFELGHLRRQFPFYLSQGEKQRLALAAILANSPKYLILDEPTTALDIFRKKKLSDILIRLVDKGIGIVIISHDKEFVDNHAQRILMMSRGEITKDERI